jgi:hypothetical protein
MTDWNGLFKKAGDVLTTAGKAAVMYTRHTEIVQVLSADLVTGTNHMERMVKAMSGEELKDFERQFLEIATTTVVNPAQRRRAMELYAWLKMAELGHYGEFRGFVSNG